MSATLTIARRELRASFDTPVPYVVLCLGLPVLGLMLFQSVGGFWQANRASMEALMVLLGYGVAVLAPVLTMRVMAEERRSGTLEMLITLPVKDYQVILGKFLGTWVVILAALGFSLLFPLLMFGLPWGLGTPMWNLGPLAWGPVGAGYLGLVLASAAAVALGLLISSVTESQVIAFIVTFLLLGILFWVDGESIPWETPATILRFISFKEHMGSMARGLITTRDVLYFLSITVLCLMGSFRALERRKWA
jgi:ABC-2 type transport system permease protein